MSDPARPLGRADSRALGELLARNVLALDPEALTPARLAKVKLCLLDLLSCLLGAAELPWTGPLQSYAAQGCGRGGSVVAGTRLLCPPGEAAFVNSAVAAGASRSDMHPPSASHPGLVIFPTLLALAGVRAPNEHRQTEQPQTEDPLSGSAFLLAALAGYEAMGRAGRALVTSDNSRRFRPSGLCGPVGAALAAARALQLPLGQTMAALGLAGNAAGGLMEWAHSGAPDLRYQPAQAARAGTVAALLAREGVEASASILEGPAGLLATFGGPPERAGQLGDPWGGAFEIDEVQFKAVPICVFAQAAAFAVRQLVEAEGRALDGSEIEAIEVATFPKAIDYPGCANPGPLVTVQEARMSIPFAVASVLVLGGLGDGNFAAFDDPRIGRLAARVTLRRDPGMEAAFPLRQQARVAISLTSGRRLSTFLEDLPDFGPDDVRARFRRCAAAALGRARAAELEEAVTTLESLPDAARIAALLRRD